MGFLPASGRTGDSGCSKEAKEGNVCQRAPTKRTHPVREAEKANRHSGTRPSLGPSARARQSSLNSARRKSNGGGAGGQVSRSGKPVKAGETGTGVWLFGRSAARRVSPLPRGRQRGTSRKGRGSRPSSLRGSRARVQCPHVVMQLQKSAGGHRVSNKPGRALQKEEAVQVNGDLVRRGPRSESFGERVVTKGCSARRSKPETAEDWRRPRVA